MNRVIPMLVFLMSSNMLLAQSGDFMSNIGKIYVVVAVIVAIFIGIMIYLIRLEKKIKQIEKQIDNEH